MKYCNGKAQADLQADPG